MKVLPYIQAHWLQIGFGWLAVQTFLKAVQDAIDAEPKGLQPIARIVYYMQAVGGYLFAGNRVQSTQQNQGGSNVQKNLNSDSSATSSVSK